MGKKTNPALIGAFVLGAVALTVVALMVWGKASLFERSHSFVSYFPGSVNGLTVGAPVKIRGVQVGEVTEIRLAYKQVLGAPRVPVFFKVIDDRLEEIGATEALKPAAVREFIERGWRARLQTLSIVTGVLFIEIDFAPGTPLELVQAEDAAYPEFPTVRTPLEEATASVTEVLKELRAIDFERIGKSVNGTLANVNNLLDRPELKTAIEELPKTIAAARRLVDNLDARTEPLIGSLQKTSNEARLSVESLRTTLVGVQGLLAPDAPLVVDVTQAVNNLGQAATALRNLADYIERNPNSLVFGKDEK